MLVTLLALLAACNGRAPVPVGSEPTRDAEETVAPAPDPSARSGASASTDPLSRLEPAVDRDRQKPHRLARQSPASRLVPEVDRELIAALADPALRERYAALPPGWYTQAELKALGLPVLDLPAISGLPPCPSGQEVFPQTELDKERAAAGLAWCAIAPENMATGKWITHGPGPPGSIPPPAPPEASAGDQPGSAEAG